MLSNVLYRSLFKSMKNNKKSGKYIPWIIITFFIVLFCAEGFFAYLAISTHPGTRVNNSYKKGIAYNKTLEQYQKQKELGLSGKLYFTTKGKFVDISFFLKDKKNNPLENFDVSTKISRPTQKGYDTTFELHGKSNGEYVNKIELPLIGIWDIYVFAKKDGNIFRMTERLLID